MNTETAQEAPTARHLAQVRLAARNAGVPVEWSDAVAARISAFPQAESTIAALAEFRSAAAPQLAQGAVTESDLQGIVDRVSTQSADGTISSEAIMATARDGLLNLLVERQSPEMGRFLPGDDTPAQVSSYGRNRVGASWDRGDGLVAKMADGLLSRVNRQHKPTMGAEYAEASLADLAGACLRASGQRTGAIFGGRSRAIEMALHSTSDFPEVLSNVANRQLLTGYEAASSALKMVSREISLNDFREAKMVRLSEGPDLDKVVEAAEYTRGTFSEGAEGITLETFGKLFGITRQALVNDQLGAFDTVAVELGRAAARKEATVFAALLAQNSGSGPTMGDSVALFHADHGNLAGSGGSISNTTLTAGRLAMRRQTGLAGARINVVPAYLLVPPEQETDAEQSLAEIYAASASDVNTFTRKLQVLVDPYLSSTTRWYLTSEAGQPEGLVHGYLDGQNEPYLDQRPGFEVDGVEWKVRLDFAAAFMDHRGWYSNPGA